MKYVFFIVESGILLFTFYILFIWALRIINENLLDMKNQIINLLGSNHKTPIQFEEINGVYGLYTYNIEL